MLLLPLDAALRDSAAPRARRAAGLRGSLRTAADEPSVVSLREVLGLIGAHEWRKKGVEIAALGARIHPYYGVFSPVRGEYVDLVARSAAAVDRTRVRYRHRHRRARRRCWRSAASSASSRPTSMPRALACARENIARLGSTGRSKWSRPICFRKAARRSSSAIRRGCRHGRASTIEHAIYDPESRMLRGFLDGLAAHLTPGGEGWLILSDFAEHLGLRTRDAACRNGSTRPA